MLFDLFASGLLLHMAAFLGTSKQRCLVCAYSMYINFSTFSADKSGYLGVVNTHSASAEITTLPAEAQFFQDPYPFGLDPVRKF